MRSKTQIKAAILKVVSPPASKNIIIILGVLVALLIGFFTMQAHPYEAKQGVLAPGVAMPSVRLVGSETLEIETSPEVLIYDKNLSLILSANMATISVHEQEHLNRLLKICNMMLSSDNTTIYQLD